ncbi:MAG: 4,5-DOPA dioxygenase extradiol [Bdellovibrionales bacterium GWB1_55_8]|nr:MAG: 4,5-DOPA dioxygenase extradiol [Bdellovibrionales bacterium GWB1_55_8]
MPLIFVGHGSPMNAVADSDYTRSLRALSNRIPNPRAILCVSAHWMSEGTWVTGMERPRTIHDFYGFPEELFRINYPASGSPEIAELIGSTVIEPQVNVDREMWGLDHGCWSVLRHIYPDASVPVLQFSVYIEQPPEYHFLLGQRLRFLREQDVLIIGSGNIVHNLREIVWDENAAPFPWAVEFDEWVKRKISERTFAPLVTELGRTESARMSVPSPDHYYPLLYVLGASDEYDELSFDHDGIQNGSISMRCLSFGLNR